MRRTADGPKQRELIMQLKANKDPTAARLETRALLASSAWGMQNLHHGVRSRSPTVRARTPNFAPNGPPPPAETRLRTEVGCHLLARRRSPDPHRAVADRGASMASKPVAFLLADLGVTKSHSRPHCSNDNPYSEAQFKTLKYRPEFPDRFGSFEDAHAFCTRLFRWYNGEHRHSGIGFHTPADVHYGRAEQVRAERAVVLDEAYAAHPERFVHKPPTPPALPTVAWINQPEDTLGTTNP
jgi:Integrase core domain